jgi:hypothetical protein
MMKWLKFRALRMIYPPLKRKELRVVQLACINKT